MGIVERSPMKILSQLIELFEKDPSFWKEWREDALSAVANRKLAPVGAESKRFRKILGGLRQRVHLRNASRLFGM